MFLCNINYEKLANVYGYENYSKLDESKKNYLGEKTRQAITKPIYWLSTLDNSSRTRLTELIK